MDMCRWMSRAAMEYIGQGGMGYTFDSLDESAKNRYLDAANGFRYFPSLQLLLPYIKLIMFMDASPLFAKTFFFRPFVPYLVKLGSSSFRRNIIDLLPFSALQEWKRTVDTLYSESVSIFKTKKQALLEGEEAVSRQVGKGKDILSILRKSFQYVTNFAGQLIVDFDSESEYGIC